MLVWAQLAVQKGLKEGGRWHLRPSPTGVARLTGVCSPCFFVCPSSPTVFRHQPAALGMQVALQPSLLLEPGWGVSTCGSPGRVSGLSLEQALPWLLHGLSQVTEFLDSWCWSLFHFAGCLWLGGWWEQPQELPTVILRIWSVTVLHCPHVCLWIDKRLRYMSFFFFSPGFCVWLLILPNENSRSQIWTHKGLRYLNGGKNP